MDYDIFLKTVEDYCVQKDVLIEKWPVGGKYNIPWGPYEVDPEPEPKYFTALDLALEKLWPEITTLEYNRLCRCLIQYGEEIDQDYDGQTIYNVKYVVLSELYDFLKRYEKV